MVLRQPASPDFAPLHSDVRRRLRVGLGRALTCRGLAAWLKGGGACLPFVPGRCTGPSAAAACPEGYKPAGLAKELPT